MQTNFWKMSFHSDSKQNMANGDYNPNPSGNLKFDEAQANNTIVSKKDVCGFEQISDNLLLQIQDTDDQNAKPTLKILYLNLLQNVEHLLRSFKTQTL